MDCFSLNVFERDSGTVWQNKTRGGLKATGKALLSVSNKCHCYEANACKGARFVQVAVDVTGKRLAAGDRHGHVYLFHLEQNRFWLVSKLGSCATAMVFTPLDERDLLVATANCSLHVFETGQRRHIAHLGGHSTCISNISVDKEGHYFLTCSLKTALVWDLLTLEILHQLNFHTEENLVNAIFTPPDSTFLTALKEERILVWDIRSFEVTHQLKTFPGSNIRTLDVSSDGHLLAAGGRASWLLIWRLWDSLGEGEEPAVLSMGAAGISSLKHLAFMAPSRQSDDKNSTHILGVVSHEGVMHFYEVETQSHLLKLSLSEDSIMSFKAARTHSWKFAVLSFSGKMLLYEFDQILSSRQKDQDGTVKNREVSPSIDKREQVLPEGYNSSKNLSDTTISQLKGIVKEYGQYPDKYRYLIWRSLLSLPNNQGAFKKLSSQPPLNVFKSIHLLYPLTNITVFRALKRILDWLCHWCPRLAEIPDLPLLVFPFVKLFHQNLHLCLELLMTFISNWCQNWWTYYPSSPFRILTAAEGLLSHHDPMLLLHFIRHGITAEVYIWLVMKSLLSEVISKEMWLNLFDHVLSNRPSFLLYIVVAFNILSRKPLMNLSEIKEFKTFFQQQQQTISVRDLVQKAYLLRQRTPANIREACTQAVGSFSPLLATDNSYSSFSNFPSIGINSLEETQKAQEKIDYIKSRQDKLLNMQTTENIKASQNSVFLPKTIRSDTCSCVTVPPRSSILSSATKENVSPKERLRLTRTSPVQNILKSSSATVHQKNGNGPDQPSTEVIQRVMEIRKKLSQQRLNEL